MWSQVHRQTQPLLDGALRRRRPLLCNLRWQSLGAIRIDELEHLRGHFERTCRLGRSPNNKPERIRICVVEYLPDCLWLDMHTTQGLECQRFATNMHPADALKEYI